MSENQQAVENAVSYDRLPSLVAHLLQSVTLLQLEVSELKKPKQSVGDIISGPELRKRLGISCPTERRWRRSGKLPYIMAAGRYRYDLNAVIGAISSNKK